VGVHVASHDVTAHATWRPSAAESGPVYFTDHGVATAARPGESVVSATYTEFVTATQSRLFRGELTVLSLQPGTYKVSGVLADADGGIMNNASVRVLSGQGAGLFSNSDNSRYNLYGVAGPVRLEASAIDHATQTRDLIVGSNLATEDFFLATTQTFYDVSGSWTLTLVAPSAGCSPGFPAAAHDRAYSLGLTQHNGRLAVDLRRASMTVVARDLFEGMVTGRRVALNFDPLTNDFTGEVLPNILDQLSATETLSFDGQVAGDLSGAEIIAALHGTIQYWTGNTTGTPAWRCTAADHAVTIKR
jgi:hypothetical protein